MKKNIVLAVIATAAMALSLVGCGVKVTNISVPDAATLEKGESITFSQERKTALSQRVRALRCR